MSLFAEVRDGIKTSQPYTSENQIAIDSFSLSSFDNSMNSHEVTHAVGQHQPSDLSAAALMDNDGHHRNQ